MRREMKALAGALALSAAVSGPMALEAKAKTADEQLAEQLAAANEELYRQVQAANEELCRQISAAYGPEAAEAFRKALGEKEAAALEPTAEAVTEAAAEAAAVAAEIVEAAAEKETGETKDEEKDEKTEAETDEETLLEANDYVTLPNKQKAQAKSGRKPAKVLSPEETLAAVMKLNGVEIEPEEAEDAEDETEIVAEAAEETEPKRYAVNWDGPVLTKEAGTVAGPSGQEYYYNLDMQPVIDRLRQAGFEGEYWVREDGVKMFGDYIMVAAAYWVHPLGTVLETTLGTAIVGDTGGFAKLSPYAIDIATNW